ncbi:MAG: hypothetical protein ABSC06_30335 [Rhodopila sp.]|jgi:hypothetical protein
MNQTTPKLRDLARDLIVHETSGRNPSEADAATVFHVTEKLRAHLVNLMGKGGFRALLARALALASVEVLWLDKVQVNAAGTFEGLETARRDVDPADYLEGRVAVLAHLLGLLVALIGPDLAERLVAEIWPDLRSTISLSVDREVQSDADN